MKAIVAVDNKWGIGKNNGLLFRLPKDMAFFKQTTTGKVVVMGANTFLSFPNGALPNRVNIVLDDKGRDFLGATVKTNLPDLLDEVAKYPTDDVFVVGGASVYKLLLPYCDTAYVTHVDADGGAEVFFPNLDEKDEWQLAECSDKVEDNGYVLAFCTYVCKNFVQNDVNSRQNTTEKSV